MSRLALIAIGTAIATIAAAPADAKPVNTTGFFYIPNGDMHSFRAYKMKHQSKFYENLHKALGLGPQWGLTEYINESGGEHEDGSSSPGKSHDCYRGSWRSGT